MNKTLTVIAAICITVIVEEIRAAFLIKEMQRRYNEQSVLLASYDERLEMLEPPK